MLATAKLNLKLTRFKKIFECIAMSSAKLLILLICLNYLVKKDTSAYTKNH